MKTASEKLLTGFTGFYYLRTIVCLVLFVAILALLMTLSPTEALQHWVKLGDRQWQAVHLVLGGLLYAVLLSLPFIPGVELGLVLMLMFGKPGIVFVYLCTVLGLSLAYAVGWGLRYLKAWHRSIDFDKGRSDVPSGRQLAHWQNRLLNSRLGSHLGYFFHSREGAVSGRRRYLGLALVFNLPGNSVFGGGGGIAMLSGASELFRWRAFLLTVMLATSPVPVLMLIGIISLEHLNT